MCHTCKMDTVTPPHLLPEGDPCTCHDRIRRTLDLIANKWAVPVIIELARAQAPIRFSRLAHSIPGITQKELTKQLRELEGAGLVTREVFPVVPPRVEYSLTALGASLDTVLDALGRWAASHGNAIAANQAAFAARGRAHSA
jgi:DNA-binding HxlR family transcriptional regulator